MPNPTPTQAPTTEGNILKIVESGTKSGSDDTPAIHYQQLEVLITKGSHVGETVTLEADQAAGTDVSYRPGDQVILNELQQPDGSKDFAITDYVRRDALLSLTGIFVLLVLVVSRWRGLLSLLAMGISFAVIFMLTLPLIMAGWHPVLVSALTALLIIPVSFYLSHGWNRKTHLAVLGTVLSLILTSVLAWIYIAAGKLTGLASEEAGFLSVEKQGAINLKNLILAGVIVGSLGILDDVTVSQVSVIEQLKVTDPTLDAKILFQRGMEVGQDHIASMVNTLVLVYVGASLPLLLLFVNNPHPFMEVINSEIIAGEIIKTLVGSIGLIFAAPVTTGLAALAYGLFHLAPATPKHPAHHHH